MTDYWQQQEDAAEQERVQRRLDDFYRFQEAHMSTAQEQQQYMGRTASWQPHPSSDIRVWVTVTNLRESYGRTDCCVMPKAGTGSTWVRLENLTFHNLLDNQEVADGNHAQ